MLSRWLIALLVSVVAMASWMFFHPSYQKSLQSRLSYSIGSYDKAYTLAKESFELDPYNRMASTVMAQSQMALKYVRYNELAEKYKKEIHRIAAQKSVTPQERAKIKMMSQIMIDSYRKNGSSVVTDKDLIERAHNNYKQFKILHDELASPR